MILVADSGASKTDWRIIYSDGSIEQAQSLGFNPYYQKASDLDKEIGEVLLPQLKTEISQIYYYGAGCSSDKNRKIIRDVLQKYFDDAHIEIWHDLLAAARSLCGSEQGIACILGTGANSCIYDGQKITENVASLGYVLGDEGSGAYLGKRLVADYLRKNLPENIWDRFKKRFDLDKDGILERVYHEEMPGRFLASFSRFLFQNIKEPYCYGLVYDSFKLFLEQNVMIYPDHQQYNVHFTGSVAFYFSNVLRQVGNDLGVSVKNIIETPIAGLTLYHQNSISK